MEQGRSRMAVRSASVQDLSLTAPGPLTPPGAVLRVSGEQYAGEDIEGEIARS